MIKVNALQIRQTFGKILKKLSASGEPIMIEKNREPVAVLISLEDFQERFIDYREEKKRQELLQKFKDSAVDVKEDSLKVLRELRYGENR